MSSNGKVARLGLSVAGMAAILAFSAVGAAQAALTQAIAATSVRVTTGPGLLAGLDDHQSERRRR